MKINNKRIVSGVSFMYTALFMGTVFVVILYFLKVRFFYAHYEVLLLVLLSFFLFLRWRGYQHVVYDSEGEVINIKVREAFLSNYFPHMEISAEFPKNKLVDFKIKDYFFKKTLILTLRSKRVESGHLRLKYNVTYLNRKEIKNLSHSLKHVTKRPADSKKDASIH